MYDVSRKTAYDVLWDVTYKGAYSNLALNNALDRAKKAKEPVNGAFVRELLYGVLENRILLDFTITRYLKQPFSRLGRQEKLLLELGIWQMDFSKVLPEFAAVNETVNLAKEAAKGREGFINAILRAHAREKGRPSEEYPTRIPLPDRKTDPVLHLVTRYSASEWIVRKWMEEFGEGKTEEMLEATLETPPLAVRVNTGKTTREELVGILKRELPHMEAKPGTLSAETILLEKREGAETAGPSPLETAAYQNGLFSVQEEASTKAVELLSPRSGETVYDVCAAPGGKTLAIGEHMKTGTIIACDIHEGKLRGISEQAKRLGITADLRTIVRDAGKEGILENSSADRVLVDAPCSGLGVLARKPEIKSREQNPDWENLPEKQLRILTESAKLVKAGGTLVYSTCTVSKTENTGVIGSFLRSRPDWKLETELELLPHRKEPDGFYIAKLSRKG